MMNSTSDEQKDENTEQNKKIKGWQIHEYGNLDVLQLNDNLSMPILNDPNEVLVKIHAASINPIDKVMIQGYGSKFFNAFKFGSPFPIILGRDFCGIVIKKGANVRNEIKIGDEVWGAIHPKQSGSLTEYACVNANNLTHRPKNINEVEAASILYVAITAWCGLFSSGGLGNNGSNMKICVLGASGGVGSVAVQIAKAENADVTAVCSTSAIPVVEKLGADHIVDYTKENAEQELSSYGPFNILLDCAGRGTDYASQTLCKYDRYVTFTSPALTDVNNYGLIGGIAKSACSIIGLNVSSYIRHRAFIKWGFFSPTLENIEYITKLVNTKKLTPLLDSTYEFDQVPEAFKKLQNGHMRGKIVIKVKNENVKS